MSKIYLTLCQVLLTKLNYRKMSFQERRTIFSVVSGWIISIIFGLYLHNYYGEQLWSTPVDFPFWGKVFVIFIGVSIGARIIVHIIFHIIYKMATNDSDIDVTDERDKLIELKSERISHWFFILGFILAMWSLTWEVPHYYWFIIFFLGGLLSELVGAIATIYFYRKGI